MARTRTAGLYKKGKYWFMDKRFLGIRIRESTKTADHKEACQYVIKRLEQIRKVKLLGERPSFTFSEAAQKFLDTQTYKRSLHNDQSRLISILETIGNYEISKIHMGTLEVWINKRKQEGVKTRTINHGLAVIRRILNLAATEWRIEGGITWLESAPKITLLKENDLREPYALSKEQQVLFFSRLPEHLKDICTFLVNTGCREQEACQLRWEWAEDVPELNTYVFKIPKEFVKNNTNRLVVLNHVAKAVVEKQRGKHPVYVFTYEGHHLSRLNNTAWRKVRNYTKIPVRVHDLKHTFGKRLRAAGVSLEDRKDLLGHTKGVITTHYCAAEIENLIIAVNKICSENHSEETVNEKIAISNIDH